MRIVLILFTLLSVLVAEDTDSQALGQRCQSWADNLQKQAGKLAAAAIGAEIALPPALPERIRGMRDELIGLAEVLTKSAAAQTAKADLAPARAICDRGEVLSDGIGEAVDEMQLMVGYAKSFQPSDTKPERQYLDPVRSMIAASVSRLTSEGRLTSPKGEEGLRRNQLYQAARMLRSELLTYPSLPAGEPPRSEFLIWCRAARARIDAELAIPLVADDAEREQQIQRMAQALHLPEQRLELWDGLLADTDRRRATDRPPYSDADGPGLPALRRVLDQQIADHRQCLALLADKEALSSEVYSEFERVMSGRNQLQGDEEVAMDAIAWQRETAKSSKELTEQVAKCSEKVRKELQGRLEQIATDTTKIQTRQLKALADHDRVDAAEAVGDLELVKLRLAALAPEAESAVGLAETEAVWRAHEKEPALREPGKRFQDLRAKLDDAFVKELKARLAQQQIQNRVNLLQLKYELSNAKVEEAQTAVQRLRDSLSEVRHELEEAAAKAADRAKDAKDAERIPLVKPGVDDF